MAVNDLAIGPLKAEHEAALADFFRALSEDGGGKFFHPHPLTAQEAHRLVNHTGRDCYCVMTEAGRVLSYGMLRGWDQGYDVPSLGIAAHPAQRGSGLGRLMMDYLHALARRRGAARVRLRVAPDNDAAIRLYKSLGYVFSSEEQGAMVGVLDLSSTSTTPSATGPHSSKG